MSSKFLALAAVAALVAAPAFAADAQLSAVKGAVTVNGKAAAGALKAGDRVVAAKGSASVKFADGCVVALKANSMVTVGAKSPCAAGAGVVSATSAQAAQEFLAGMSAGTATAVAVGTFVVLGGALAVAGNEASTESP